MLPDFSWRLARALVLLAARPARSEVELEESALSSALLQHELLMLVQDGGNHLAWNKGLALRRPPQGTSGQTEQHTAGSHKSNRTLWHWLRKEQYHGEKKQNEAACVEDQEYVRS